MANSRVGAAYLLIAADGASANARDLPSRTFSIMPEAKEDKSILYL